MMDVTEERRILNPCATFDHKTMLRQNRDAKCAKSSENQIVKMPCGKEEHTDARIKNQLKVTQMSYKNPTGIKSNDKEAIDNANTVKCSICINENKTMSTSATRRYRGSSEHLKQNSDS